MHDASGKSIVIEYVGGKLNVHDDPLGVITNSPTFDWHMTNLRNYVNFSMTNAPPVQAGLGHAQADRPGLGHARDCPAISRRPRASFAPSRSASRCFRQRPATTRSSRRSTS